MRLFVCCSLNAKIASISLVAIRPTIIRIQDHLKCYRNKACHKHCLPCQFDALVIYRQITKHQTSWGWPLLFFLLQLRYNVLFCRYKTYIYRADLSAPVQKAVGLAIWVWVKTGRAADLQEGPDSWAWRRVYFLYLAEQRYFCHTKTSSPGLDQLRASSLYDCSRNSVILPGNCTAI